jgi:hypothetical protein
MDMNSLCKSLKCGLCCFFEDDEGVQGLGVNKDFELKVFNEIEHPCSKLNIKIVKGVIEAMSCSIHETSDFPNLCSVQPACSVCYKIGIESIKYKGKPLDFNEELKKLVLCYQ